MPLQKFTQRIMMNLIDGKYLSFINNALFFRIKKRVARDWYGRMKNNLNLRNSYPVGTVEASSPIRWLSFVSNLQS